MKWLLTPWCWIVGHAKGRPAFELPETDETNKYINSNLLIYRCPRCDGDYVN